MGEITELAKRLLVGGLGRNDVRKLKALAAKDGVSEAEKVELRSLLTLPGVGDKFTAAGKKALEDFLGRATDVPPPAPGPVPVAAKPVSSIVPSLSGVTDAKLLADKFKADLLAVKADLTGHPSLKDADKEARTVEFFAAYASKFNQLAYSLDEDSRMEIAKKFGEVLKTVPFGGGLTADVDGDGTIAGVEKLLGDSPDAFNVRADHKPWSSTYWPMAGNLGQPDGSASSNLWAKGGPFDKFDQLLKARNKKTGALEYERQPNLAFLLGDSKVMKGKPRVSDSNKKGWFIPSSSLSEKDAEKTTGLDLNGNGKLDDKVEWDFLDRFGNFGTDGKTEGTMSVGWWGHCNEVALAGNLFKEPKKDVTVDGVTFTAQDVKGLLSAIADSQRVGTRWAGNRYDNETDTIRLKDGKSLKGRIQTPIELYQEGATRPIGDIVELTKGFPAEVKITTEAGEEKTVKAAEIKSILREDKRDDAGLFHDSIRDWLRSGMSMVMDKDSGEHVWNYNFWKVEDKETTEKPSWAPEKLFGYFGPTSGGQISYVDRAVTLGGDFGSTERYTYWLERKNGKIVNSGWAPSSSNPDFLWGPMRQATFTGSNARNPFVDPVLVKELYEKSIA